MRLVLAAIAALTLASCTPQSGGPAHGYNVEEKSIAQAGVNWLTPPVSRPLSAR